MQREWAATLASEGRHTEAVMHLQVLPTHPVQHCTGTQGSGRQGRSSEAGMQLQVRLLLPGGPA